MAGGTANHARRAAPLFGAGNHHGADDAHGLRSGIAADRGAHRLRRRSARPRSRGAGSLDIEPAEQDAGSAAPPAARSRSAAFTGGQHRPEARRGRRWLVEKHGTSRRRSWRKLHIGIDGESGEIVAIELTKKRATTPPELTRCSTSSPIPWRPSRYGAYDQDRVYETVAERHPDAAVIVPPRATAVPGPSATTAPTQRDRHIQEIVAHGRMGWQKSSGYNLRAKVEAAIGRYKRVIGDALRSRTDQTEATEVAIAAAALNRMLELGRPNCVRIG